MSPHSTAANGEQLRLTDSHALKMARWDHYVCESKKPTDILLKPEGFLNAMQQVG